MMPIPTAYKPLTAGRIDQVSIEASALWLAEIWDYRPKEYTFLGVKVGDRWRDVPIKGDRASRILDILAKYPPHIYDIYFCPNAFDRPSRKAQYAAPSHCGWCDIDGNDIARYEPAPNIVWETSPGRHQGLWIWRRDTAAEIAEQYSRNIVYKDGGDKNGWSITKMLRLPGTINHKPEYAKPVVTLRAHDPRPQKLPASLRKIETRLRTNDPAGEPLDLGGIDAEEVVKRYRSRVSLFARVLMTAKRVIYPDRSEAIFIVVSDLVMAGARDAEIAGVLLINPHFVEKHGFNSVIAQREIVCIRDKVEAGR